MANRAITRVRIIAAGPFGLKTEQFIGHLEKHPRLNVEVIQNDSLPDDHVVPYSEVAADRFFRIHRAFYLEQIQEAQASNQFPMLVSGNTHHFSAPFLVALQQAYSIRPKVVSFDYHSDCYSRRLDQGGFWTWLIHNGFLAGRDLTIVGTSVGKGSLAYAKFYPQPLIDEIELNFATYEQNSSQDSVSGRKFIEQFVIKHIPDVKTFKDLFPEETWQFFSRGSMRDPVLTLETILPKIVNLIGSYYSSMLEPKLILDNGINISSLEKSSFLGENVFVSLDCDVSCSRSFTIALLRSYLRLLSSARIIGLHVEEIDCSRNHFDPEEIAQVTAEELLLR